MQELINQLGWKKVLSAGLVVIGVLVGAGGAVRTGSILIAVGAGIYTAVQYSRSESKRKIELVLPLLIALLLFVVALTLPHAK
jgi:drug/metabolite transporter (DMT)-like permease